MCVGDWRLGRLIKPVITRFNTLGSVNIAYPPNPCRVGITLAQGLGAAFLSGLSESGGPLPAAVSISGELDDAYAFKVLIDSNDGIIITSLALPWHITLATHGALPTRRFSIASVLQDVNGLVIEYFLPEDVLSAALESFKTDYGKYKPLSI